MQFKCCSGVGQNKFKYDNVTVNSLSPDKYFKSLRGSYRKIIHSLNDTLSEHSPVELFLLMFQYLLMAFPPKILFTLLTHTEPAGYKVYSSITSLFCCCKNLFTSFMDKSSSLSSLLSIIIWTFGY